MITIINNVYYGQPETMQYTGYNPMAFERAWSKRPCESSLLGGECQSSLLESGNVHNAFRLSSECYSFMKMWCCHQAVQNRSFLYQRVSPPKLSP